MNLEFPMNFFSLYNSATSSVSNAFKVKSIQKNTALMMDIAQAKCDYMIQYS